MKFLVFLSMLLVAYAAKLERYNLPAPQDVPDTRSTGSTDISSSFRPPPAEQRPSSVGAPLTVSRTNEEISQSISGQFSHATNGFSVGPTQSSVSEQSFTGQVTDSFATGPTKSAFASQFSDNTIQPSAKPVQSEVSNTQSAFNRDSSTSVSSKAPLGGDCPEGQIKHFDGRCVTPEVTRNVFVYAAPQRPRKVDVTPADIPLPKVEHNIVFIRTDELQKANEPIIVPPPMRKDIIYVLNQESQFGGQRVIEITTPEPRQPEVYFVNYADGQTPTLPDGTDFETALRSAIHSEGQVIGGSSALEIREEQASGFSGDVETASSFSRDFDDSSAFVADEGDRRAGAAFTGRYNAPGTSLGSAGTSPNQETFTGIVAFPSNREDGDFNDGVVNSRGDAASISSNLINNGRRDSSTSSGNRGTQFPSSTFQSNQPAAATITPQNLYNTP